MNVKIMGADQSVTNVSAGHWIPTIQASTARSRLYKISITNLSAGVIYLWIFDSAAVTTGSASPVMTRRIPAGLSDTWDFNSDGSLFQNGIGWVVSSTAPTDPTTTPTAAASDAAIVKADLRVR